MEDDYWHEYTREQLVEIIVELKQKILELQGMIQEMNYERLKKQANVEPIIHSRHTKRSL